jgi:sulfhydrogenase subunit beta (sulfur reductase)
MLESSTHSASPPVVVEATELQRLFDLLRDQGYTIVAPRVRDGAIVVDTVENLQDLPIGWTDLQAPAEYRLEPRADDAIFGFNHGPQSWKNILFPPRQKLWSAARTNGGDDFELQTPQYDPPRLALVGVRACDLAAIAVLDRVFIDSAYGDPMYTERRGNTLLIAVNCSTAASTCFCTSFDTGPEVHRGFDLALTELQDEGHRFLIVAGSRIGEQLVASLRAPAASIEDISAARRVVESTAASIGRHLEIRGLPELLVDSPEHAVWQDVAEKCLSCSNCTMVCPTCFCSTVEDVTDLAGDTAERWQKWDSCFTLDFSYIHGGPVRASVSARYRHWMTHKLATWLDQFGTFGCVGCGRCITWCPVGIDITELAARIQTPSPAPVPLARQ